MAFKHAAGGLCVVNPPAKDPLLFIARVDYRGHTIKIARRGQDIRLLVHAPGTFLARHMIIDALANYEHALHEARRVIDEMVDSSDV